MDLSETIIAAIIGAGATMATAIFQLMRSRAGEVRPRRNRLRSLLATIVLMIGCIVGGYAWSSLRSVSATEEMRSTLKSEFSSQFATLAAHRPDAAHPPADSAAVPARPPASAGPGTMVKLTPCVPATAPAEPGQAACTEPALVLTLCTVLADAARSPRLEVKAHPFDPGAPWQAATADSSPMPDLRVTEPRSEASTESGGQTSCLDVANWSTADTFLVRLQVDAPEDPGHPQ